MKTLYLINDIFYSTDNHISSNPVSPLVDSMFSFSEFVALLFIAKNSITKPIIPNGIDKPSISPKFYYSSLSVVF